MISVGIDVSKGKSTVAIMKPGGEVLVAPFDVTHTQESLSSLVDRLEEFNEDVRVVLEATGNYHLPITVFLAENRVFVSVVNALRMNKFCSQDLRRAKTDKKDALKIAAYGITYWGELTAYSVADETYSQLRILSRQYHQMVSILVKSKVNLSNLLDQVMPGIKTLLVDSKGNYKLSKFVERYYHFDNILDMGERRFTSDYCKWAKKQGYLMNERKAKAIFASAQEAIPVISNTSATKLVVLETVRVLLETEKSRKAILTQMTEVVKTLPEYSVVLEMGGVGEVLAPRLIAEIGDIRRFNNHNSLIAYAGIDVPPYQSGKFTATERHISKRGNKYLRKVGYETMESLIMHQRLLEDDPVLQFIQRKRGEGKAYKKAMIAGFNKFLRIYYARVSEVYANTATQ